MLPDLCAGMWEGGQERACTACRLRESSLDSRQTLAPGLHQMHLLPGLIPAHTSAPSGAGLGQALESSLFCLAVIGLWTPPHRVLTHLRLCSFRKQQRKKKKKVKNRRNRLQAWSHQPLSCLAADAERGALQQAAQPQQAVERGAAEDGCLRGRHGAINPFPAWLQTLRRAPRQRLRSTSRQWRGARQHPQAMAPPLALATEGARQLMSVTEKGPLSIPATRRGAMPPPLAAAATGRRRGRLRSSTLASPVTGLAAS